MSSYKAVCRCVQVRTPPTTWCAAWRWRHTTRCRPSWLATPSWNSPCRPHKCRTWRCAPCRCRATTASRPRSTCATWRGTSICEYDTTLQTSYTPCRPRCSVRYLKRNRDLRMWKCSGNLMCACRSLKTNFNFSSLQFFMCYIIN